VFLNNGFPNPFKKPKQISRFNCLYTDNKKNPFQGPFVLKPKSLGQPALNGRGAVFCFPFLQRLVVPAFGFDKSRQHAFP
jgi:hypothetical protein